jgi:hypothetical protein
LPPSSRFGGADTEDPYKHLDLFEEICDTFKQKDFTQDEVKFRLFGQSLIGKARAWFNVSPIKINTRDMLSSAFLTYYYPASKMMKVTSMLTNFKNHLGESLYDGLDRFKGFLINYPHHGFPPSLTIIFLCRT